MPIRKRRTARKAAKKTAKHALHGALSKSRREPLRSGGLMSIGALIGAGVAWMVAARGRGRRSAAAQSTI